MARVITCREPKKWEVVKENYRTSPLPDFEDILGYFNRADAKLEELAAVSRKVDLKQTVVGVLVKFPVADGYAFYRVVKDKPLTLEHIPVGDAWQADHRLIRGLRVADIRNDEERERSLAAYFAKKGS